MDGAKQKYAFSVEKITQISDGPKKIIKIILAMACVLLVVVAVMMLVRSLKRHHSEKSDSGDEVASLCTRLINNPVLNANIAPSPQSGYDCSFKDIFSCICDDSDVPSYQCCEEVEKHKTCLCVYTGRYGYNDLHRTKIDACHVGADIVCHA